MSRQDRQAVRDGIELVELEDSIRDELRPLLADGADVFRPARWNRKSEWILDLRRRSRRAVELRGRLDLDEAAGPAHHYLAACDELNEGGPHRRGPVRLAQALLAQLDEPSVDVS